MAQLTAVKKGQSISSKAADRSGLITNELRNRARWIRDELHPSIIKTGPEVIDVDTLAQLKEFLGRLLKEQLPQETIRHSRIHKALMLINDKTTPWPNDLVEMCEPILLKWTQLYGSLADLHPELYGPGGRLYGIARPHEISRRELLRRWANDSRLVVSPMRAFENGHLGFKPGHWWIHPIFAYYDGVISSPEPKGGIVADGEGAYAVVLTDVDKVDDMSGPETFIYRPRSDDPGRFRLMNNLLPIKTSIRLFRSHTLRSNYAPIAGIRYDGLYKITTWSGRGVNGVWMFEMTLQRDFDQLSWSRVAYHPTAEEIDDYLAYRRIREQHERLITTSQTVDTFRQDRQDGNDSETRQSPRVRFLNSVSSEQEPPDPSPKSEDVHMRRDGTVKVNVDEADLEELQELRAFEFPMKSAQHLNRSRPMPGLYSPERL